MKLVIAGGTGQVGQILRRAFKSKGHQVCILARSGGDAVWDGRTQGSWQAAIDDCDVVINLAGRSVNCRYTKDNLAQMMSSRVDSTKAIGQAIASAAKPPKLWLQMSTATIYAHSFDQSNDEYTGIIGGNEPAVPSYWRNSVEIARAWERAVAESDTPSTRKVILRSTMVMSPDKGGIFDVLYQLARLGLGGSVGGGSQYVSWIHDHDFVRAVEFLVEHSEITGAVNLASPGPLPQASFMSKLRKTAGIRIGLPATAWMAEIGAFFLRTDTELLLKSRRVIPTRLLENGFTFDYPDWDRASQDLVNRRRKHQA